MTYALEIGSWVGIAALFGLLIGSFLNVCIYRLPAGITIVRGHSFCPRCKHPLKALDLVPVFSYLFLSRRCRYCHEPIAPRYAKIELLTGLYYALAAWTIRPGQYDFPDWFPGFGNAAAYMADYYAALVLLVLTVLSFSGLLVWAMIIWDGHLAPKGLYIFIAAPMVLHLVLQPARIPSQLAACLLGGLIFGFLVLLRLLPESTASQKWHFGAGLGLLSLMSGLQAVQPVLAVTVTELMLMALLAGRGRRSATNRSTAERASQLWRSLPLQMLMIGSVLLLFF